MSNATTTEQTKGEIIKACGEAFGKDIPESVWAKVLVKKDGGKVDLDDTRKALGQALREYLKATGQLYQGGSKPAEVDWSNIEKALYRAFVGLAKDGGAEGPKAPLQAVVYAGMTALAPSFEDMDKVRKLCRTALDREDSMFKVLSTGKNFEGAQVTLKEPAKAGVPQPFLTWAQMHAPAETPAPAPAAPAAETPAKGKGKGKK